MADGGFGFQRSQTSRTGRRLTSRTRKQKAVAARQPYLENPEPVNWNVKKVWQLVAAQGSSVQLRTGVILEGGKILKNMW